MLRAKGFRAPSASASRPAGSVRQPVVLQPALPRFVRPGDRFVASAVGRVVEGEGGTGSAEARVEGLVLGAPPNRRSSGDRTAPPRSTSR
jgi:hypothetical protein